MVAALTAGSAARAQDPGQIVSDPTAAIPDPGATGEQLATEQNLHSGLTPVAKPGCQIGWTQWAGALYRGLSDEEKCGYEDHRQLDEDQELEWASSTPVTVDFYTVSFINSDLGLAGGAQCEDDPAPRGSDEERSAYEQRLTEFLKDCTRVPVIYRYVGEDPELGAHWAQAYKGTSPGYVGAISWLRNTDVQKNGRRALAVGGTGVYVRRERGDIKDSGCEQEAASAAPGVDQSGRNDTVSAERALSDCEDRWRRAHDPAGMGRAWLLIGGRWRDLNAEGEVPARMRGMNALDASTRTDDCIVDGGPARRECAMAGGLQQIWMWADNHFDPIPWDPDIGDTDPQTNRSRTTESCGGGGTTWACDWHFRIRAIRFRPTVSGAIAARAVTAGCCSATGRPADQSRGGASVVEYSRSGFAPGWGAGSERAVDATSGVGPSRQHRKPNRLADSFYALDFTANAISYISTPGGPERPGEPPSHIINKSGLQILPGLVDPREALRYYVSSARLISGEGDLQGHQPDFSGKAQGGAADSDPDGLIDWAVGGFKASDRGAAYTTTTMSFDAFLGQDVPHPPYPLTCTSPEILDNATSPKEIPNECGVDQSEVAKGRGDIFSLSSYFLNGYTTVGNTGIAWGVGDRGAIMRLAGDAAKGGAGGTLPPENAPRLGARALSPAPPREPYGAGPDLAGEPGLVPSLASAEQVKLPEPRVTSYGTPTPQAARLRLGAEAVVDIATSRDGGEAWAIGPSAGSRAPTTLYHFDGERWSRCSPDALEGVLAADPACEALWPLFHFKTGVAVTAIARVPLEHDSDPSNDDEFEATAAGYYPNGNGPNGSDHVVILRYREGRWSVDSQATEETRFSGSSSSVTDIAYSAPDDGWMVSQNRSGADLSIFHFDGERWTSCASFGLTLGLGQFQGNEDKAVCQDQGADGATGFIPVGDHSDLLRLTSAGRRLYMYGNRQANVSGVTGVSTSGQFPLILYKDPGPCTEVDASGCWRQAYDPGCANHKQGGACVASSNRRDQGTLGSLSVALHEDGSYNGWGVGFFGTGRLGGPNGTRLRLTKRAHETPLLHAEPEGTSSANGWSWAPEPVEGAPADYLLGAEIPKSDKSVNVFGKDPGAARVVALPGPDGEGRVFVAASTGGGNGANGPIVWLDPERDRWRVLPTPFGAIHGTFNRNAGAIRQIAPDNSGGLWIVGEPIVHAAGDFFYRFSDFAPKEVFEDVTNPVREQITATAGGPDGSFWVATDTNAVYRYDRITGWDRITVKGWDAGRVVTSPSDATAIAVGPGGKGILVGEQGRIAEVGPGGAALDRAAGLLCVEAQSAPCGTGRSLRAAAIDPEGAALVGGDARALLYRPPGGEFRSATPPPALISAAITGISMPGPGTAYLVTSTGQIYSGSFDGADWSWTREDRNELGDSIVRDVRNPAIHHRLQGIAVDAQGHGYAVGDQGTILERTGEGQHPWRRVDAGYLEDLTAVTLAPGGRGALIGGEDGLVLTGTRGRFEPAYSSDRYAPILQPDSKVAGMALLPGYRDGQVEGWVALRTSPGLWPGQNAVLHYSSDPSEPLLDGGTHRAESLPDSPPATPEELGFAAFGNSGCQYGGVGNEGALCAELIGSQHTNDVTARAVRDAVLTDASDAPRFALFTGDVSQYGGHARNNDEDLTTPLELSLIHRRWTELIAQPLLDSGVPVYGAVGRRDLSTADSCYTWPVLGSCATGWAGFAAGGSRFRTTSSVGWRQAMTPMPAPWGEPGAPPAPSRGGLSFESVETENRPAEPGDQPVEDPTEGVEATVPDRTDEAQDQAGVQDETVTLPINSTPREATVPPHPGDQTVRGGVIGDQIIPTGGAHTHYAFDVKRGGEAILRVVVLDSSLDSLAASDPNQNPTEAQLPWLREVLESWPAEKRAVVVTNTPTYSYGPGALSDTAPDGTVLESILMANDVDLVVSGRLAWNGVYWALAPGVHCPETGGAHPDPNRLPTVVGCGGASGSDADKAAQGLQNQAGDALGGGVGVDPLPVVIASSAGVGPFGPRGGDSGSAANGFWHGYTNIRIDPNTDEPPIIEQRPVFDWIGITVPPDANTNATHVLRPNQKLDLDGYGREAAGIDLRFRYDEINSPSIMHRFELLVADSAKPWLPKQGSAEDECDPYDCLDTSVGTIDQQSGDVKAGAGRQVRTFAIAQLSVGEHTGLYPLVFEPRSSFRAPTPSLPRPTLPPPPSAPSQPPQPGTPAVEPPAPPAVPPVESALAITPVIPPTPPSYGNASPIDLGLAPVAIVAPPPAVVLQPPNPVVQPAPPSGARREARQRQAATQKSGADAASEEIQGSGGDLASSPDAQIGTQAATRAAEGRSGAHPARRGERSRPEPSFTPISVAEQPSAWARGLLYGGGLTILAFCLAFGFSRAGPTPRRRPPEVPAPAVSRASDRDR